jgi:hypothetical protein
MILDNRNYKTCKLIKNRVDLYLFEMAKLFANLGSNSTAEEYALAYKRENEMIDKIAELDPEKARSIRPYGS